MSESNLKQLSLGLQQYTQDFGEKLPPMQTPAAFKKAVYPYVKTDSVFNQPTANKPYALNASLSHRSLSAIADPAATVAMYESVPMPDNTRAIAFSDGHVKRIPKASGPLYSAPPISLSPPKVPDYIFRLAGIIAPYVPNLSGGR